MSAPFVAEIRIFPFNFSPVGWADCNGQLLPISQNTALFSLLGTTYGGDGKSTFALPNLQGRAPMHPGQGPGLSLRERQLVTLAANIALARPTGNYSHYRSARHIGITHQEICEVIIQVGHYAGWPTISNAVRQYTAVLEEEEAIKRGKKKKPTLV